MVVKPNVTLEQGGFSNSLGSMGKPDGLATISNSPDLLHCVKDELLMEACS